MSEPQSPSVLSPATIVEKSANGPEACRVSGTDEANDWPIIPDDLKLYRVEDRLFVFCCHFIGPESTHSPAIPIPPIVLHGDRHLSPETRPVLARRKYRRHDTAFRTSRHVPGQIPVGRLTMVGRPVVNAANDGQMVHLPSHQRQVFGDPVPGNAGRNRLKLTANLAARAGLHIERVDMTHSAPAEHHDHAPSPPEAAQTRTVCL